MAPGSRGNLPAALAVRSGSEGPGRTCVRPGMARPRGSLRSCRKSPAKIPLPPADSGGRIRLAPSRKCLLHNVALLAVSTGAAFLVLSGLWKLSSPTKAAVDMISSVRLKGGTASPARLLVLALAAGEVLIGASILLLPSASGWTIPLAISVLVGLTIVLILRAPSRLQCGCWRPSSFPASKSVLILRNLVLSLFLLSGTLLQAQNASDRLIALAFGALVAGVMLEVPGSLAGFREIRSMVSPRS